MTQSKLYIECRNNGVIALVSETVAEDWAKCLLIVDTLKDRLNVSEAKARSMIRNVRLGRPIFTFCSEERIDKSPWFTGTTDLLALLEEHIKREGGRVICDSFYVPFSNGFEAGNGFPLDIQQAELAFVTTGRDFVDEFGISEIELLKKYSH